MISNNNFFNIQMFYSRNTLGAVTGMVGAILRFQLIPYQKVSIELAWWHQGHSPKTVTLAVIHLLLAQGKCFKHRPPGRGSPGDYVATRTYLTKEHVMVQ